MTETSARTATSPRRRRRSVLRILLAAALGGVAVVAGSIAVSGYLEQQGLPTDMRGTPVRLAQPPQAVLARIDAVDAANGLRLRVPQTGLDVPLGELNEVDGIIDPRGFSSAYLVRNYGANLSNAATGTVFAVMHSCRGGAVCPGNYLIDVEAGTASTAIGADVYLGGLHYRVTGSESVFKPDVRNAATVWDNRPGRLVLLTCLQVPEQTESVDNLIITAELVGGPGEGGPG